MFLDVGPIQISIDRRSRHIRTAIWYSLDAWKRRQAPKVPRFGPILIVSLPVEPVQEQQHRPWTLRNPPSQWTRRQVYWQINMSIVLQ